MGSIPGALTEAELASIGQGIDGKTAHLAVVPAAWFKKLERELVEEFGFAPQFRHGGAYRTAAEQREINPGTSPALSDHCKGRAIDIRNYGAFMTRDVTRYRRALDRNGFRNIQVDGRPFPSEPWHEVCTKTIPPPIEKPKREEDFMPFNIVKASTLKAGKHVAGTLCATVGGYPVGFDEYARKPGSADDRAPLMGKLHGPHEAVSDAVWAELRARYTPSTLTGGGATAAQVADELAERMQE